jgi:hypothetical protein
MSIKIGAALILGVAGVFVMTGTAGAADGHGHACDRSVGDCAVSAPSGIRSPCVPALAVDHAASVSAVTVVADAVLGFLCVR